MHPHLTLVNGVVFLFLSFIWSAKSFNVFFKLGFLLLGLINLAVLFGVKL